MPTLPNTLTVSMDSILGVLSGPGPSPTQEPLEGYVEVTLCGFGPILPTVNGSKMLGDGGIPQRLGPDSDFSIVLFANDGISPDGTFYSIAVLDQKKNVIQAGNYFLTGAGPWNLAALSPTVNPPYNAPSNYRIVNPATGAVTIDNRGWNGPVTIDLTLTGNVTLTLTNFLRGQIVQFIIRQDATGARTVTWPASVKNPALVNDAAHSITTMSMIVDQFGNFYPQLGWS